MSHVAGRVLQGGGAATGILFAAALAGAYLSAPPMPQAGTPAPVLVHYVALNSEALERSWFLVSGPSLLLGAWLLGVASVALWEAGASHVLVAAGIFSSVLAGSLLATASVCWGLFVYLAPQLGSGPLVLVLAESRHFAEGSVSFPAAGAAAALSLAIWRFGPSWRALSALGVAAAALQLGNGIDDFLADGITGVLGPLSFGALMLWIAAFSCGLAVRNSWLAPKAARRAVRQTASATMPLDSRASSPLRMSQRPAVMRSLYENWLGARRLRPRSVNQMGASRP